jgi:hypothetical protein
LLGTQGHIFRFWGWRKTSSSWLENASWIDDVHGCSHQTLHFRNFPACHVGMGQNPIPLVNIKIAGKWMFIPLKMVSIGIDPYPCWHRTGSWNHQTATEKSLTFYGRQDTSKSFFTTGFAREQAEITFFSRNSWWDC